MARTRKDPWTQSPAQHGYAPNPATYDTRPQPAPRGYVPPAVMANYDVRPQDPTGLRGNTAMEAVFANFDPTTYDTRAGLDENMQAFLAGLAQPQVDPNALPGGGPGVGDGGQATALAQIAEQYKSQLGELDRQNTTGGAEIDKARGDARTAIDARQADNTKVNADMNTAIQADYAAAMRATQDEAAKLAAELQKFGVDPSRIAPGTSQSASYLEQQRAAQGTLQTRMGQISNDALSARQSNADLIQQGARGQLSNNYSAMRMQLDQQRAASEASARQQAAARRSGGGGDDLMTQLKLENQMLDNALLEKKLNGDGPKFDLSMLEPGTPAYQAAQVGNMGGDPYGFLQKQYSSEVVVGQKPDGTDIYKDSFDSDLYGQDLSMLGYSYGQPIPQSALPAAPRYPNATKKKTTTLSKMSFNSR